MTSINRPGADFTALFDINNRGQIAGVGPAGAPPTTPAATDMSASMARRGFG